MSLGDERSERNTRDKPNSHKSRLGLIYVKSEYEKIYTCAVEVPLKVLVVKLRHVQIQRGIVKVLCGWSLVGSPCLYVLFFFL